MCIFLCLLHHSSVCSIHAWRWWSVCVCKMMSVLTRVCVCRCDQQDPPGVVSVASQIMEASHSSTSRRCVCAVVDVISLTVLLCCCCCCVGESYLPPRDDINAPDLYIPVSLLLFTLCSLGVTHSLSSPQTMAFVSYVLVVAFLMGEAWQYDTSR